MTSLIVAVTAFLALLAIRRLALLVTVCLQIFRHDAVPDFASDFGMGDCDSTARSVAVAALHRNQLYSIRKAVEFDVLHVLCRQQTAEFWSC